MFRNCRMWLFGFSLFICVASQLSAENINAFQKIINEVIGVNTTWKAGHNFNPDQYVPADLSYLCGTLKKKNPNNEEILPTMYRQFKIKIPFLFQSGGHWPFCPTIKQVSDQGSCGSDWAVSAAHTMSDRICIFSQGRIVTQLSAEDLLSCCGWRCGQGCRGGYPLAAWNYWQWIGIVSGSSYSDKKYCQPYSFPPCSHDGSGPRPLCNETNETPECSGTCQGNKSLVYEHDKYFGVDSYKVSSDVDQIQMEMFINGPVQATMKVYADFLTYKVGVYQHVAGRFLGIHSVRIVGWGEEQNIRYWTVANSWNSDWGEKGFFKILREVDECGIESSVIAGRPRIDDSLKRGWEEEKRKKIPRGGKSVF